MDLELVAIHEDAGRSAKTLHRPGLQAALNALAEGQADGLLVTKLDRLTRSVRDLAELLDLYFGESPTRATAITRFSLLSMGDSIDTRTAGGRLVLNVLTSVSQWEREAISERTKTAMAHLKSRGVRLGAPAIPEPTAARIRALRGEGLSLRDICERLNLEGVPTLRGGRWAPKVVRAALLRAA